MDLSFVVKPKENPGDNPKTLNDTWAKSRADFDRSINQSLGWDDTIVPCNDTQLERTQLEVTQIPSSLDTTWILNDKGQKTYGGFEDWVKREKLLVTH